MAEPASVTARPAVGEATSGSVAVVRAALCRDFETSGTPDWRCVVASDNEPARRLVFYTRLSSPRATTVEHRWYLNDTMRQQVRLRIPPSNAGSYRTYSASAAASGTWRVELRDSSGLLLHQARVTVP